MPLYPILATNIDITILINLGQSRFSYSPSNAHRTPNPCFIGPLVNAHASATSPTLGREDSQELFSMGRIDAEWLSHSSTVRSTVSNGSDFFILNTRSNHNKVGEYEEENESEFFEIVLDSTWLVWRAGGFNSFWYVWVHIFVGFIFVWTRLDQQMIDCTRLDGIVKWLCMKWMLEEREKLGGSFLFPLELHVLFF